jgi:hypothetical protein
MLENEIGKCDKCGIEFGYYLVHNGFNESSYVYCDTCGKTAFLNEYSTEMPKGYKNLLLRSGDRYRKITKDMELYLEKCSCGGSFKHDASPRCPYCKNQLSPIFAKEYIEKDSPGAEKGGRWQESWDGLYAIVVERNVVRDNWRKVPPSLKERIKFTFGEIAKKIKRRAVHNFQNFKNI